jgi:hypothetical protein
MLLIISLLYIIYSKKNFNVSTIIYLSRRITTDDAEACGLENEVLFLTEDEVAKILTMEDTLESVEKAFSEKARGRVQIT